MNLYLEFDRLVDAFETAGIEYALIGGLAVGMHGYLRATKDIDLLVLPGEIEEILTVMRELGYLQTSDPWTFKNSGLTLWRFIKPVPGQEEVLVTDVLVAKRPEHQQMVARSLRFELGENRLSVVSREDLIHLKEARNSTQDAADIENLRRGGATDAEC